MTDEEFVKGVGKVYKAIMDLRKDEDFVVNQPQMDKLIEVYSFFEDIADKSGSSQVEPLELAPKEEHGYVTATFLVFDIDQEEVPRFSKIIGYTSGVCIDVMDDKVCISVTIPEVFIPKSNVIKQIK